MNILAIAGTNITSGAGRPVVEEQSPLVRAIRKCLSSVNTAGHNCSYISLVRHRIDYCTHCETCDHQETCSLNDDFWQVYEKMKSADCTVFFTSVTYAMMSPKLAALLQRAGRIGRQHGMKFKGKRIGVFTEEFGRGGELVLGQFAIWAEAVGMIPPVSERFAVGKRQDGRHSTAEEMEHARLQAAQALSEKLLKLTT